MSMGASDGDPTEQSIAEDAYEHAQSAARAKRKYGSVAPGVRGRQARKLRDPHAFEKVREIERDETYTHETLPALSPEHGAISGAQAYDLLRAGGWRTAYELSQQDGRSHNSFQKTLIWNSPQDALRYRVGKRTTYLFSPTMAIPPLRVTKNVADPQSPNSVAKRLGITPERVRILAKNLDLGTREEGKYRLSDSDEQTLRDVLEREQTLYQRMLESVEPQQRYTFTELRRLGVPTVPLQNAVRQGRLPLQLEDAVRIVEGREVLRYLREEYDPSHLSAGLRLITYFHPQLHDVTSMVEKTGMSRKMVRKYVLRLLDEQPESCFRLVAPSGRMSIIGTQDVLETLLDWEHRGERQLLRLTDRYPLERNAVRGALSSFPKLIDKDGMIPLDAMEQAFGHMQDLYNHGKQPVLERSHVALQDLRLLRNYMKRREYVGLQLEDLITPEQIDDILAGMPSDEEVSGAVAQAEEVLFLSNAYLIDNFRPGVRVREYEQLAAKQLLRTIRAYRPGAGVKFPVFAGHYLDLLAHRARELGPEEDATSASAGFATFNKSVTGMAQQPEEYLITKDLASKIRQTLSGALDTRELAFIMARFGIGTHRKTYNELAEQFGMTRDNARTFERKALRQLQQNTGLRRIMMELQ